MSARKRRPSARERFDLWREDHPALASWLVFLCVVASIVGLYLFILYSGLNSTADFIYNQF